MESNAEDKEADAITTNPYPITNGETIAQLLFKTFFHYLLHLDIFRI